MSSSIEAEIWGEPAASARSESVRDRLSMAQPVPENFYERCTHSISGDRCDVCRAIRERDAAQPAPTPTASQTAVAQPMPFLSGTTIVPAPAAEPVPEVVRMAHDLADSITACTKLQQKIVGLEAPLEFARSELAIAESAKTAAQSALRRLVEEETS